MGKTRPVLFIAHDFKGVISDLQGRASGNWASGPAHAQSKVWSGTEILPNLIMLPEHDPEEWVTVFREGHAQSKT
jgi:hypothetical protein